LKIYRWQVSISYGNQKMFNRRNLTLNPTHICHQQPN